MMIFGIEQVGEILHRLFQSGIFYDIEHEAGKITYDIGNEKSGFISVLDENESNSISYTVSRLAREAAEEYPESDFARWYNEYPSKAGRRFVFELLGKKVYHEFVFSEKTGQIFKGDRYVYEDGEEVVFGCFGIDMKNTGILEFSKK